MKERKDIKSWTLFVLGVLFAMISMAEAGCGDIKLQMTGGDGFVVEFGPDGKLYNSYHHQNATVNCNDPLTGDLCPGYPPTALPLDPMFKSLNWTEMTGEKDIRLIKSRTVGVYYGTQFLCLDPSRPECFEFFMPLTYMMSTGKQYFGIGCYNVKTRQLCDSHPVTILNPVAVYSTRTLTEGGIHRLTRIGNKFYSLDSGLNILCYDIETHERCKDFPRLFASKSLPAALPNKGHTDFAYAMQYLEYKGRPSFYIAVAYASFKMKDFFKIRFTCIDLNTFEICQEFNNRAFALSKGRSAHVGDFFFEYDRQGEPISICSFPFRDAKQGLCKSLSDPNQVTSNDLIDDLITITNNNNHGIFSVFRHDNRMYWGTATIEGIFCYDFTTRSGCPNFPTSESKLSGDLPTMDYGVTLDPSGECFYSLGHTNAIYSFDSQGNVPCRNATLPNTLSDLFILSDFVESTLDVLSNDSFFAPSTLKIISPPSSPHIAVVDGKIIFTPTQAVDRFEYQVCSPSFNPATSSASVTVRVCRNQDDLDGNGVVDCLEDVQHIQDGSKHQHDEL